MTDLESAAGISPLPSPGQIRKRPKQHTPSPSPDSSGFKEMAAKALNVMSSRVRQDDCSTFGEFVAAELRSLLPIVLTRTLLDFMDELTDVMVST